MVAGDSPRLSMRSTWVRFVRSSSAGRGRWGSRGAAAACSTARRNSRIAPSSRTSFAKLFFCSVRISIFSVQNRYRHNPRPAASNPQRRIVMVSLLLHEPPAGRAGFNAARQQGGIGVAKALRAAGNALDPDPIVAVYDNHLAGRNHLFVHDNVYRVVHGAVELDNGSRGQLQDILKGKLDLAEGDADRQ